MIRLRRLAIVLMTVAVITTAIYATGAFTSITAQRGATITVAGDAAGYLALKPAPGPNGGYATIQNGELHISVGGARDGSAGGGINKQSVTVMRNVFTITNQGTQPLGVWLTDKTDAITFSGGTTGTSLEGRKHAIALTPGTTLYVGLTVDTRGKKITGDLMTSITIHANADVSGANLDTGPTKPVRDTTGTTTTAPSSTSKTDEKSPSKSDSSSKSKAKGDNAPSWSRPKSHSKSDSGSVDLSNMEKGAAFIEGAIFGGAGSGFLGFLVPDNYVSSPLYLLGNVLGSFIPGWGTVKDVTGLIQSILNGDLMGIVINGIALIPALGSIADGGQVMKVISKWVNRFPSSTDEALDLFLPLLKYMPDSVSMSIMAKFSDGPVNALRKSGVPADDILKYKQKGYDLHKIANLRHRGISPRAISKFVDEGYSPRQIRLMVDSGFRKGDLKKFVDEGYSFGFVYKLHTNKGIPVDDLRHYVDEGISLQRIKTLRKRGIPANDIRRYVDADISLHRVADLRNQGISPADIRKYVNEGVDLRRVKRLRKQGISPDTISTAVDKGYNLRKVSQLRHQGIPVEDIEDYVKKGTSLRLVGYLNSKGYSSKAIRKTLKFGQALQLASLPAGIGKEIYGWCHKYPESAKNTLVCQPLLSNSQQTSQNGNTRTAARPTPKITHGSYV